MIDTQSSDFSRALTDVRKAYRLLYGYQQRVLDLVKFIGDYWSLTFVSGNPWYTNGTPKGKYVKFDSGWDWLMLYYYDFYFERIDNDNNLQLGVIIQSDTGYYDDDSKASNANAVNEFAKPEESETRIILMASNGKWDSSEIRTKHFGRDKSQYPAVDDARTIHDDDIKIIAKAYNLVRFIDEASTKQVLGEFEQFCTDKGIINISQK